ncbi:MAG: hypothetical protein Q4B22_01355 [Eubacteriales bacterium]|nr:hypothetical protein [Eubacteriales bacterium]
MASKKGRRNNQNRNVKQGAAEAIAQVEVIAGGAADPAEAIKTEKAPEEKAAAAVEKSPAADAGKAAKPAAEAVGKEVEKTVDATAIFSEEALDAIREAEALAREEAEMEAERAARVKAREKADAELREAEKIVDKQRKGTIDEFGFAQFPGEGVQEAGKDAKASAASGGRKNKKNNKNNKNNYNRNTQDTVSGKASTPNRPEKKPQDTKNKKKNDSGKLIRYIELAILVLFLIAAALLAIRFVQTRRANAAAAATASSIEIEAPKAEEKVDTQKEEKKEEKKEEVKAASTESVSSASKEEEKEEPYEGTPENGKLSAGTAGVDESIEAYFESLRADQGDIESYSNISSLVYPGNNKGEYVVFIKYAYKFFDYEEQIPALTELYIITDDEGSAAVVTDETPEMTAAMDTAESSDAVQALISQVQQEYDSVVNSNDDLAYYVSIR